MRDGEGRIGFSRAAARDVDAAHRLLEGPDVDEEAEDWDEDEPDDTESESPDAPEPVGSNDA